MAIKSVTAVLTSTNFLALAVIFLFAFTGVLHWFARIVGTFYDITRHLAIVSSLLFFALLVFPFMTLYCQIRHKKFPPNYRFVLARRNDGKQIFEGDFGKRGENLYRFYFNHRHHLRRSVVPLKIFFSTKIGDPVKKLVEPFASTLGGLWKKLKEFFRNPTTTTMPPADTLDDTSHQSIGMYSLSSDTSSGM